MRVGIGGVFQETNTFATDWMGPAGLDRFVVHAHDALDDAYRGTLTEVGGAIEAADRLDVDLVPLTFAIATPGPTVAKVAYDALADRLLTDLHERGSFDAVVLVLHGAGVVEKCGSLELDLVRRVRATVGPTVPVVVTLDLHAMVPAAAVDMVDLLLPYHYYPHTDMADRGREAVEQAVALVAGGRPPRTTAVVHVPLLVTAGATGAGEPMREVLGACWEREGLPGVVDVSVQHGFPFSDVPDAGVHVTVTAVPPADAARLAVEVAQLVWDRRERLVGAARPVDEAVEDALRLAQSAPPGRPVVVSDSADNPGGGAPGDSTHVLRALLAAGAPSALVAALTDPEAVAAAARAGVGGTIDVALGGRMGPLQGAPVERPAVVRALSDGRWVATTAMGSGAEYDMGPAALLAFDGVEVVVCSEPTQVFDPAVLAALGVGAADYAIVVLKSSTHFRAGFGDVAHAIVTADAPGVTSMDLAAFPRSASAEPPFPLADHDGWVPRAHIGAPR